MLQLTAQSLHELQEDELEAVRDVVIWVISSSGKQIAYEDDTRTPPDGLQPTDAFIPKLLLPTAGDYRIYVDTYGGIFATEVMFTIESADLFDSDIVSDDNQITINAALPRSVPFRHILELEAGDVITVTVRDRSGTLDPLLRLLDGDENTIAMNDDHGTSDLTLDVLDSRLDSFEIPADGEYTLMVTDFLSRAGQFEVIITID